MRLLPASLGTRRNPAAAARRWTFVVGAVCAIGGWLAAGPEGLTGGLAATVIVVAFLSTGQVPVLIAQAPQSYAGLSLVVLLLTYALRLALVLAAFVLLNRTDFVDSRWLGLTAVAAALTWTIAHVGHTV
ncbi:MAG TPA: hypothetical protein VK925_01900, partial [Jiangellaceae bacterium]|nr:hypothetical protein [Jiangellaceae bacterium]